MLETMPILLVSLLLGQMPPSLPDPSTPVGAPAVAQPPHGDPVWHGRPGAWSVTTAPAPQETAQTVSPASATASPPMFAPPAPSYLPPSGSSWENAGKAGDASAACRSGQCGSGSPIQQTSAVSGDPLRMPLPSTPEPAPPAPAAMGAESKLMSSVDPSPSMGAQSPCLSLETVGPPTTSPSKPFSYEIVVRNTGTFPVINVRIDNPLPERSRLLSTEPQAEEQKQPAGLNKLIWNLARLEPGAERRFKVNLQPTTAATEYVCNATATFSVTSALHCKVVEPKLALSQTGPDTVQVGDRCLFAIRITNTGSGPASHVLLREKLPAGLKHPEGTDIEADFGTIAPGATKSITLPTTAVGGGRQACEAQVSSEDSQIIRASALVTVSEASLFLHNTGPGHRIINHEADFNLEVLNTGTAPATNVVVTDSLPEGLDFISAAQGGMYDAATRTVHWNVGALPAGEQRSLSLKLLTRSAGDLVNRAVVRADRGLEAKAEASVHAEGIAALMLEVVDLQDPIEVGTETTYEIRVVNQGTATSTGIHVVATVPEGMSPRGAAGPVPYRIHGQQVVFEPLAKLAAHADCVFRVTVVGQQPGDCRFKVQMSCEQLRVPVYKEESTRVYKE